MDIDRTTLVDLEVFASPDGRGGLFEMIARTGTSVGRAALRRRMEQPSSDIAAIRHVQRAVEFLAERPGAVRLDEASVANVSRYLRSNIAIEPDSRLRDRFVQAWMTVRYRDLLAEIDIGVKATLSLFGYVGGMCRSIGSTDPPSAIAGVLERLLSTAEQVQRARSEAETIVGLDRALRSILRDDIEAALRLLGELDALNAMAIATETFGWSIPILVDSEAFVVEAEGLYHPFVPDPVANPVRLTGGEPMVFLTGPNMAGKTTYLRSVALMVLLAQIGMGVPARQVRLSPVEALFTSLNPSDNLRAGLSYFYAEVLRVKAAAAILAEGKRALVIFDEVFKGTNVKDALDASAAVILGFARARRSGFIFSSHLVELVEILEEDSAIRFACFDGEIDGGRPHYSYELKDGVSAKRFGLLLLEQAQVPELMAQIGRGNPHCETLVPSGRFSSTALC